MLDEEEKPIIVNEYNRSFQFDDSDLRLVSADGVVFKIHTWKLKAASSVFQVMFESGNNGDTLELTDKTLEIGRILCMFLQILYGIKLAEPSSGWDLKRNHEELLRLIDKYDAPAAKQHLTTCFRLWAASEKFESDGYFLLASQLDEYEIATTSLKHAMACRRTWTGPSEGMESRQALLSQGLKGENTTDGAGWPLNDFRRLSHEYIFGFMRAKEIVMQPNKPRVDYKLLAAKFEKIMTDLTLEEAN
ncbi:hypothetical protein L486_07829 [Kwoniella mangroviensis CBS 10435]|uniref:BTB domain-containing protein n=1 Tax=Kwoniella mangroviensis CBS 10435 TaxID=1331196 RepID=A0A1B9IGK8_9TREE|nr:hypothetical protein L486_07829 [Kwoniella mangroviensis CBS 10435]